MKEDSLVDWPNCNCGARSVTVAVNGYFCKECYEKQEKEHSKQTLKEKNSEKT